MTGSRLLRRMAGRDIHESHRVSTPLELLFDLTFVVAIAAAASQLHHAVGEHPLGPGMLAYFTSFAAIWWAWMNFAWFAGAYDTDDPTYRLWTMLQMVGVLILAAGVPKIAQGDFTTLTIGYAVMRIGLVAMWLRAAREHPERCRTAMRYALGIGVLQLLWLARLALSAAWSLPSFFVLMLLELAIPVWAAKADHTPWHAHHIAERYGLFTIIVLGECVLGATNVLLTLWWLHRHIARGQAQLGWAWAAALAILVVVVAAVAAGLPLAGAIPAVTLAPAFIIMVIDRGRLARPDLYSVQ